MDVLITVMPDDEVPHVLQRQLCCSRTEKVEAKSKENIDQFVAHIQNYSVRAAKSFIAEVKKYPIIYVASRNSRSSTNTSTTLAWSRIVTSLLGDEMESNPNGPQTQYWEQSFRELWDWMRLVFEKDMKQQSNQAIHVRSVTYSWLSCMRFLEPYICLRGTPSDIDTELNQDISIHIKSFASESNTNTEASCTYWLNHPEEPIETKDIYISICIRNPLILSLNRDYTEQSGLEVQLTSSNQFIQDLFDPVDFNEILSTQSNTPSSPTSSLNLQPLLAFDEIQFEGCIVEEANPLPPLNSSQIWVDEDYDYIMSFLPLLKQFEPEKSAEVKVSLIKAIAEDL